MKRQYKSQGDVNFVPVGKLPTGERKRIADGIIVRGEKTGHHHSVAELDKAELYQVGSEMYLSVGEEGVSIQHQEHSPVPLEPGIWKIHQDQAFDYSAQAIRNVAD